MNLDPRFRFVFTGNERKLAVKHIACISKKLEYVERNKHNDDIFKLNVDF